MRDRRRGFIYQTLPALNALRLRFDGRVEGDDKRLSLNTALGLYVVLTELANEARGDDFRASQGQVATLAGSTRPTVNRYLSVFVEVGLLEVERVTGRNGDEPSFYALIDPAEGATQTTGGRNSDDTQGVNSDDTDTKKEEELPSLRSGSGVSARARDLPKFSGKPVNREAWALTERVLVEFNQQTAKKLRLLSSDGSPSEAAKRIYGRVRKYRDLRLEDYADIIRRTLASKWWGEGEAGIGVVFGEKVFEDNITRQIKQVGAPVGSKEAERLERQRERFEEAQRLAAEGR